MALGIQVPGAVSTPGSFVPGLRGAGAHQRFHTALHPTPSIYGNLVKRVGTKVLDNVHILASLAERAMGSKALIHIHVKGS